MRGSAWFLQRARSRSSASLDTLGTAAVSAVKCSGGLEYSSVESPRRVRRPRDVRVASKLLLGYPAGEESDELPRDLAAGCYEMHAPLFIRYERIGSETGIVPRYGTTP